MEPIRDKPYFSVALPSSTLEEVPSLREKTLKVGFIGRALAVFRVEEVYIFKDPFDPHPKDNISLLELLLSYQETPQYLRKMLFPRDPSLRYAGLLPPLRTPHHPLEEDSTTYRDGVVVRAFRRGALVDVGLKELVYVEGVKGKEGERVTVKLVKKGDTYTGSLVNRDLLNIYWGFRILTAGGLRDLLLEARRKRYLIIATSKYGDLINEVLDEIKARLKGVERAMLIFGSARRGLYQMAERERFELHELTDYVLNFVPHQGTKTVRTEEALIAVLSILNLLKYIG